MPPGGRGGSRNSSGCRSSGRGGWSPTGRTPGSSLLGLAGFLHYTPEGRPLAAGALRGAHGPEAAPAGRVRGAAARRCLVRAAGESRSPPVWVSSRCHSGLALADKPERDRAVPRCRARSRPGCGPVHGWTLPVPSYWLRMRLAPDAVLGAVRPVRDRVRRAASSGGFGKRKRWDWTRALPLVVAVSVLTTPYGGWIFDLPVLLVPVIAAARRGSLHPALPRSRRSSRGRVAVTVVSFATPRALARLLVGCARGAGACLLAVRKMPAATSTTRAEADMADGDSQAQGRDRRRRVRRAARGPAG